jgi:hypothetical protein
MTEIMDWILKFAKEFNLQSLTGMAIIIWYFSRDIKNSIEKLDHDINKMNTRVSRLEGTVYGGEIYKKIDSE